ncbi:MAG: aldehyde ferredoxin oxidoreductase [Chitinophagales bacterium]
MAQYGGWTGKTLRVDLTTGKITTEDTIAKYKDYLGGSGVGYKVLWDEVPAGTRALDPANKIVVGVGPLTGTGAPSGGRTSITTISPVVWPKDLVITGHMGGHFGAELKYAGWDNIIIEGVSPKPVYLAIQDDQVEIRDAAHIWGNGVYRTTDEICQEMGQETIVAAIGQAGENLVPQSVVMNSYSHSAGGVGAVFGAKKLKAIAVRGTGSVKMKGDRAQYEALINSILALMGANNNHVVPRSPQPWAEFSDSGSRWTAKRGQFWGAAMPPVETGVCDPHDLNRMGYRTNLANYFFGDVADRYFVRTGGCASCPIRCMAHLDMPQMETKYGTSRYAANTCVGLMKGRSVFKSFPDGAQGLTALEAGALGTHMADDLGVWDSYNLLERTFQYAYYKGIIKANVPEKEYNSIAWDKYEKGDPEFLIDFYRRIAYRTGEFGKMFGESIGYLVEKWKFPEDYFDDHYVVWWKMGHPKHHSSEDAGQVGVLINLMYNRDSQCHSHCNIFRNGLPIKQKKAVMAKIFGSPDVIDDLKNWTPMNPYKAKFAAWSLFRKELHDSLTLCNWMWPFAFSPLKERNYEGDTSLESKLYSIVTGDQKTEKELDEVAERIFNLHRALTIRDMGTKDMRKEHDTVPEWVFDEPKDKAPFTPGHDKMDRADIELAKDLFYKELGWDVATGAPTRATYERLGMKEVADKLAALHLLP